MVAIVHPGIAFCRRLIGRDRCFGDEALNGCATWANGTLLCGALVFLTWPHLSFWSLALVPLIPILAAIFWPAYYSFAAARVRKREFDIQDGVLIRRRDAMLLTPEFAINSGWYEQTGPATGYSVATIQLGQGDTLLATNVYVDYALAKQDLARVMDVAGSKGCRMLDLHFVAQTDQKEWQVVRLTPGWTPVVCGPLARLSDADRAWWRQWCQPDFGALGRATVPSDVIAEHLDRLLIAYPILDERHESDEPNHDETPTLNLLLGVTRTHDDVRALRSLLSRHPEILVVAGHAHREEVDRFVNKRSSIEHRFDRHGVEIETIRRWN